MKRLDGIYPVPKFIEYQDDSSKVIAMNRYPHNTLNLSWAGVNTVEIYPMNPRLPKLVRSL